MPIAEGDGLFVLTDERGCAAILRTGRGISRDAQSRLRNLRFRTLIGGAWAPYGRKAEHATACRRSSGAPVQARLRSSRTAVSEKNQTNSFQLLKLYMRFADLVVMAGWLHPFPFRTRP